MIEDTDAVQRLAGVVAQAPTVDAVWLGERGSFLVIRLAGRTGHWHLALAMCAWRIEGRDEVVVGSEDVRSTIVELAGGLVGQSLRSIESGLPWCDIDICFDTDRVRTFSIYPYADGAEKDPYDWMLYAPDGTVICFQDGSWAVRDQETADAFVTQYRLRIIDNATPQIRDRQGCTEFDS